MVCMGGGISGWVGRAIDDAIYGVKCWVHPILLLAPRGWNVGSSGNRILELIYLSTTSNVRGISKEKTNIEYFSQFLPGD